MGVVRGGADEDPEVDRVVKPARAAAIALALALIVGGGIARAQQDSLEAEKRKELEQLNQQAREKRAQAGTLKGQETRAIGDLKRTERDLAASRKRLSPVSVTPSSSNDGLFSAYPSAHPSSMSVPMSVSRTTFMRASCADAPLQGSTRQASAASARTQERMDA